MRTDGVSESCPRNKRGAQRDKHLVSFGLFVLVAAVAAIQVVPWLVAIVAAALAIASYMGVCWWGSGWLVPLLYKARPLQQVHPELAAVFAQELVAFAQQTGIRPPHIYLVESPFAGAYGVGGGRGGTIMVPTTLLEHLSYHEVWPMRWRTCGRATPSCWPPTPVGRFTAWVLVEVAVVLPLMVLSGVGVIIGARRQVVVVRRVTRQVPPYIDALVARSVSLLMAWASRDAEFAADRLSALLAG